MKYERIILDVAVEDYGTGNIGGLDYVIDTLQHLPIECVLMDYDSIPMKLIKDEDMANRLPDKSDDALSKFITAEDFLTT
tara:strand:- start:866 stop:1105 length:240 start_codon:yes stop_codon:yes gene_type:complete